MSQTGNVSAELDTDGEYENESSANRVVTANVNHRDVTTNINQNQVFFPTGTSHLMNRVRQLITQVSDFTTNVLITGESGTGKEWAARYMHELSPRRDEPFVPVNCGAIPSELLESELFGHEKGAFSGAVATRMGRFEVAEGGTMFLDEIGDMSLSMQVKLLRVIQERVFERVGSNRSRSCDVRIIAATHRNLEQAILDGNFREDLFYRLNVFPIELPALRDRTDDIDALIENILNRCSQNGLQPAEITPGAVRVLKQYDWPGNIRELGNLVERLCILYPGESVDITQLPTRYTSKAVLRESDLKDVASTRASGPQPQDFDLPAEGMPLKTYLENVEIALIRRALYQANGVAAQAARQLQIGRTTLAEKMKRYKIPAHQ